MKRTAPIIGLSALQLPSTGPVLNVLPNYTTTTPTPGGAAVTPPPIVAPAPPVIQDTTPTPVPVIEPAPTNWFAADSGVLGLSNGGAIAAGAGVAGVLGILAWAISK